MTTKLVAFLDDNVNKVGWTETWYTNATGTLDGVAGGFLSAYQAPRLSILLDTCQLTALRASNVDHPRDSYWKPVGVAGSISHTAQAPDAPWSALLVRKDSISFNAFNHWFVRGIPQTIFAGRTYTPLVGYGVTFDSNIGTLILAIKAYGSVLRKGPGPSYTYPVWDNQSGMVRTERRPGRPFAVFRGRRAVA